MNALTIRYIFFIPKRDSFEVQEPKYLDEYIRIESKLAAGSFCIHLWFENSPAFVRIKEVDLMWWSAHSKEIPKEMLLWATLSNIELHLAKQE